MKFLEQIPIFLPSHPLKIIWDFIQVLTICFFLFFIPVHIAVGVNMNELMTVELRTLAIVIVFADVLVSMNTGFFEKGVCQIDRWKVMNYYIENYFTVDFFVNFVLLSSDSFAFGAWFDILFFLKIRMFYKVLTK